MDDLTQLAARCATAATGLLTGAPAPPRDVRYLADCYLSMARALLDCREAADPYLYAVNTREWHACEYWRRWLCSADLTAAQEAEHAAIAERWAAILAIWEQEEGDAA